MDNPNVDQERTILRVRLDNLAQVINKLAGVLAHTESSAISSIFEPQAISRLKVLANSLSTLKSLEERNDGEIFASFLKSTFDILQNSGKPPKGITDPEVLDQMSKIIRALKALEDPIKKLLPIVVAIDEARKKTGFETFGGLMQKTIDAVEEKCHLILRSRDSE